MILMLLIAGAIIFFLCFKYTILGFWLSLTAGVAAIILLKFIIKLFNKFIKPKTQDNTPLDKIAQEVVREGMEKLRQISSYTRTIRSNEIAKKIKDICLVGVEIFDDIKKSPNDVKKVKLFTNYYLDATTKIIKEYAELSGRINHNPDIKTTLEKIEGTLDSIKQTFDKQLANLLEDDLFDINTELTVLKNTMKMES
jgi:5-bromo-4-chloroindolyl phosphate hydrolysis protein